MPFDGNETKTEQALRRAILADTLRGELPQGQTWDFSEVRRKTSCGFVGCAIATANALWPDDIILPRTVGSISENLEVNLADFFGMYPREVSLVFFSYSYHGGSDMKDVTPAMVADALDKIGQD